MSERTPLSYAERTYRSVGALIMKLEVVVIPVSDVDRAKQFYARIGWRLDADISQGAHFRVVQFTPPGSACSIHFGLGLTAAAPGSVQGLYLVVEDIGATVETLRRLGVEVGAITYREAPGQAMREGRHPQRLSYSSFATFADPDENLWLLQEITTRLPGRVTADAAVSVTAGTLAAALRRAAVAHGEHERRSGVANENWPEWYAEFIHRESWGEEQLF